MPLSYQTRLRLYEAAKRALEDLGLSAEEYFKAVKELAKKYKI